MSESENLNFDLPSRKDLDDSLRMLHDLVPQPLDADRDELFFQAGFAAGRNHRRAGYFWPSTAAALLLVCAGLGVAVVSDAVSMNRMQQELASVQIAAA